MNITVLSSLTSFFVRWTGEISVPANGSYVFQSQTDDGFRLFIGNLTTSIGSFWNTRAVASTNSSSISLIAGVWYPFRMDYFDATLEAVAILAYSRNGATFVNVTSSQFRYNGCKPFLNSTTTIFTTSRTGLFQIALSSPPTSPVTVELKSCFPMSLCSVTFNSTNWGNPVNVTIFSDGTTPSNCTIDATSSSEDPNFDGLTTSGAVVYSSSGIPTSTATLYCSNAWGDPHYTTFDGKKFDYFGLGNFYFARQFNGEFSIQTILDKCGKASCQFAVAVRFKSTVYYVFLNRNTGVINTQTVGDPFSDGVTIAASGNVYTFVTSTGIVVDIVSSYWSTFKLFYFDVTLCVPVCYLTHLTGLMGYFDGNSANDYRAPNGTVVTNPLDFGEAWRVSDSENLFAAFNATIPALLNINPSCTTSGPRSCEPNVIPPCTPLASNNYCLPPIPPPCKVNCSSIVCDLEADPAATAIARGYCDPFFNSTSALCCQSSPLNISANSYYRSCICDYLLAGDASFSASSVEAFNKECEQKKTLLNVAGCNPCPKGCSGNGVCNNGTCNCTTPFTGNDCSQNSTEPPDVVSVNANSTICADSQTSVSATFQVFGKFFYGSLLYCQLRGQTILATKVSDNILICTFTDTPSNLLTSNGNLFVIRNQTISPSSVTVSITGNTCFPPTCIDLRTPANVVLVPSIATQIFTVSVSGGFLQPVTINFTSDCVYLSNCSLTIQPGDSSPKVITILDNTNNPIKSCTINVTSNGTCSISPITVLKSSTSSVTALSFGDPHYITWNRQHYPYFGTGDFYFVRQTNGELVIQTRLVPCGGASCNGAVAVYFKGVIFYLTMSIKSGVPVVSAIGSLSSQGITFTTSGATYTLTFPTGLTVTITINYVSFYFLGVEVSAGPYYLGKLVGLAGYYNTDKSKIFMLPNGIVLPQVETDQQILSFVLPWLVPNSENLFTANTSAVIPSILSGISSSQTSSTFDASCSTYATSGDNGGSIPTGVISFGSNAVQGTNSNCTFATQELADAAHAVCSQYFNDTVSQCCSNLGVSGDLYFASCLCDYNLAGGANFMTQSVNAYYSDCNLQAVVLNTTSCRPCPSACNLRGNCDQGVCQCTSNYRGADCSENWDQKPNISSTDRATYGLNCRSVVSITGKYFYGSSLNCTFDGVTVSATKVTNYQIQCSLPTIFSVATTAVSLTVTRSDGKTSDPFMLSLVPACCNNPCQNGGRCIGDRFGNNFTFSCDCFNTGFNGTLCETPFDPCSSNPCLNQGVCSKTGKITFSCNCTNTGFTGFRCEFRGTCPSLVEDNALWPRGLMQLVTTGVCQTGYFGSPTRYCNVNGTFGPISNPCTSATGTCPLQTFANAQWASTAALSQATGTCVEGFSGTPKRKCKNGGIWESFVSPLCQRNVCPSNTTSGITFPATFSLTTANGVCPSGFYGAPTLYCQADGTWSPSMGGTSCTPLGSCPTQTYARVIWPTTTGNTIAYGTCISGWKQGISAPIRKCNSNGTWQDLVNNHCVRA